MDNFKSLSKREKLLFLSQILCSISIILLALLQLFGIWDQAIRVFEPLIGVLLVIMAIRSWDEKNKTTFLILLTAATFVFGVTLIVYLR